MPPKAIVKTEKFTVTAETSPMSSGTKLTTVPQVISTKLKGWILKTYAPYKGPLWAVPEDVKRKWAKLAQAYAQVDYKSEIAPEVLASKMSALISYARSTRLNDKEPEEPEMELPLSDFDISWFDEVWAKIQMELPKDAPQPSAAPPQLPGDVSTRIERVEKSMINMEHKFDTLVGLIEKLSQPQLPAPPALKAPAPTPAPASSAPAPAPAAGAPSSASASSSSSGDEAVPVPKTTKTRGKKRRTPAPAPPPRKRG